VPAAITRTGAYPFAAASKDAAIYTTFAPGGGNTAHIVGSTGGTGVALAEVFDATENPSDASPRLSNLSARAQVGTGDNVLIGGFIIGGSAPVTVLIRAVGPSLAQFGVNGVLADPILELHSNSALLQTNDNWSEANNVAEIASVMAQRTFALPANSKDSVVLVALAPGLYSAVIRGAGNTTGVALLELYEVR
jgi:hypothetical protein